MNSTRLRMAKSHRITSYQRSLYLAQPSGWVSSHLLRVISTVHVEKIVTRKTYFSRHLCSLLRGSSCGEAKNDRNDPKKETPSSAIRSDSILTDWLILLESNRRKGTPTSEGRESWSGGRSVAWSWVRELETRPNSPLMVGNQVTHIIITSL